LSVLYRIHSDSRGGCASGADAGVSARRFRGCAAAPRAGPLPWMAPGPGGRFTAGPDAPLAPHKAGTRRHAATGGPGGIAVRQRPRSLHKGLLRSSGGPSATLRRTALAFRLFGEGIADPHRPPQRRVLFLPDRMGVFPHRPSRRGPAFFLGAHPQTKDHIALRMGPQAAPRTLNQSLRPFPLAPALAAAMPRHSAPLPAEWAWRRSALRFLRPRGPDAQRGPRPGPLPFLCRIPQRWAPKVPVDFSRIPLQNVWFTPNLRRGRFLLGLPCLKP